jgi:DMSO/TMAO reductase YedYZ molybdopterin-dependent catalytic subunit
MGIGMGVSVPKAIRDNSDHIAANRRRKGAPVRVVGPRKIAFKMISWLLAEIIRVSGAFP